MALRTADDDPSLNPGQQHSDNQFNALKKAESNGAAGLNSGSSDNVKNAEENPSGDWQNNVSGDKQPNSSRSTKFFGAVKKKGPLTAIILTLVGGGLGIGGLLSPGLLLIQIKEMMVNKFNVQLTSMEIRTNKILTSKVTGGIACGKTISIMCKYSSFSEAQIAKLEKAGITIEDGTKNIFGTKPKSFKFNGGDSIPASKFASELEKNAEFRSAFKTAYSSKFAGFADGIWNKAMAYLKISKKAPVFEGEDFESKINSMEKDLQTATAATEVKSVTGEDIDPETGNPYNADAATAESKLASANEVIDTGNAAIKDLREAGGVAKSEASASLKALKGAEEFFRVTAPLDVVCNFYRATKAVGYAAKTVRAMQLAFYAMMFLNVADQIKAGVAKTEDVSFLGTVLTKESPDDEGNPKSATDSFGYKYAAYGDVGAMPTSAIMFMTGAGFAGSMVNAVQKATPVVVDKGCKALGNPIIGGISIVAGVALTAFTWGGSKAFLSGISTAMKVAAKSPVTYLIVGSVAAEMFLPNLLKDILAGNLVDSTTIGAYAGDGITSGASAMMGTSAKYGGNAPLKTEEAVAYNKLSQTIAAQYAEEDRLALSPFDATNSNTFIGSIVARLVPYASKMSSLSGIFSSIASLATGSIASTASAETSGYDYKMCQDYNYRNMDLATDPYCNVTYGIPIDALNADPIEVTRNLTGLIDDTTGDAIPGLAYDTFIQECINRTEPLGELSDSLTDMNNGSNCFYNKKTNGDFYIHYIDQRVQKGMDGEDPILAAAEASGQTGISFYSNSNINTTALNTGGVK